MKKLFLTGVIFASLVSAHGQELIDSEETITIVADKALSAYESNSSQVRRSGTFIDTFVVSRPQETEITGIVASTPGVIINSANQFHARGEHSGAFIYLEGFQLGGVAQGRFGPLIDPRALKSVDVITGGYAPEHVGGAGVINSVIRSGRDGTVRQLEVGGGSYETSFGNFSLSGSTEGLRKSSSFHYFLSGNVRGTSNVAEAPQPRNQTAHNFGVSQSYLTHLEYELDKDNLISLIFSTSPAKTQIANRTGLRDGYAPYGQGFGFGGALSRADALTQGILSQDELRQNIYQEDQNDFGILQWKHIVDEKTSLVISTGGISSRLDTLNNNPLDASQALPYDSSLEFNPTVKRRSTQAQIAARINHTIGDHEVTIGGMFNDESSKESYQLIAQSQLALNALFAADPRLAPQVESLKDSSGNVLTDKNGNEEVRTVKGAQTPTLRVKGDGYAAALYAQDFWRISDQISALYGVRLDQYEQKSDLGAPRVSRGQISPRASFAYEIFPSWTARVSYDRLFVEPPVAQGAVIGEGIIPERVHQGEVSLEKQLSERQKAKVAFYKKKIKNQVDTSLLIPSTQMGLFNSVTLDRADVTGVEFSYDLLPEHQKGFGAYLVYARSVAQPQGFESTGEPVEDYNDHDQRHTAHAGVAYTFENKALLSLEAMYGSGLASSVVEEGSPRKALSRVDLSAATAPDAIAGVAGLRFSINNLFDERDRINFNSGFSGTRFQQGRTFVISTYATF